MATPFSTTYIANRNSTFYKPVERVQKLAVMLNELGESFVIENINSPISPTVKLAKNYVVLNYRPGTQTQEIGDPTIFKALLNLVTESALGNIHAERGLHMSAFSNDGAFVPHFGVVQPNYSGEWSEDISGLEAVKSNTGNVDRDALRNQRWYILSKEAGMLVVGKQLKKMDWVGDNRLIPDQIKINNAWLVKTEALDLLLSDKPLFCFFNDEMSAYVAEKWYQFHMDVETLKTRKGELLGGYKVRRAIATGHGLVEAALEEQSQAEQISGVPQPVIVPAIVGKVTHIRLLGTDGNIDSVEIASLPSCTLNKYVNGMRARQQLDLGDDLLSRTVLAVEAKAGVVFEINR